MAHHSPAVVSQLMEQYHIRYQDIGRLEVGSESMVDNSKAIKTTLMQLFQESGNHDVEGRKPEISMDEIFDSYHPVISQEWILSMDVTEEPTPYLIVFNGCKAIFGMGDMR